MLLLKPGVRIAGPRPGTLLAAVAAERVRHHGPQTTDLGPRSCRGDTSDQPFSCQRATRRHLSARKVCGCPRGGAGQGLTPLRARA
jgi:hypothetical protein